MGFYDKTIGHPVSDFPNKESHFEVAIYFNQNNAPDAKAAVVATLEDICEMIDSGAEIVMEVTDTSDFVSLWTVNKYGAHRVARKRPVHDPANLIPLPEGLQ